MPLQNEQRDNEISMLFHSREQMSGLNIIERIIKC